MYFHSLLKYEMSWSQLYHSLPDLLVPLLQSHRKFPAFAGNLFISQKKKKLQIHGKALIGLPLKRLYLNRNRLSYLPKRLLDNLNVDQLSVVDFSGLSSFSFFPSFFHLSLL